MPLFSDKSLLYFKTVCERGTIRHASTVLKIAPSAISRQISLLEESLGVLLFVRKKNSMVITPYGKQLLLYSNAQDYRQNILLKEFNNIKTGNSGQITVAMGGGFIQDAIDNIIMPISQTNPDIKFSIISESLKGINKALEDGTADIGLTYNAVISKGLKIIHNSVQPMCVILPKSHSLADSENIRLKDLDQEKIIMVNENHSVFTTIMQSASIQNIDFKVALQVNSISALIDCMAKGQFVAFLPAFCVRKYIDEGILIAKPLLDTGLSNTYTNIIVENDSFISPLTQVTIDLITNEMEAFK